MITNDILYLGVNDRDIDLFEGQYIVPEGISYNSYLIMDEKTAVMDTVDQRKKEEYLTNLENALKGRCPDYLVVSHVEPDHASSVAAFLDKYPSAQLVGNAKTFQMLSQFFDLNLENAVTVKEGDVLSLGRHQLHFTMAPMVHWPEVMFTYDSYDKVLFSADAFGKFGALDAKEDWLCEARRYYFNIVGKFGMPVQAVLKKAAALDIRIICPLHGPVLKENLGYYLEKYQIWSSYQPEDEGVFIAPWQYCRRCQKACGIFNGKGLQSRNSRSGKGGYGRSPGKCIPLQQNGSGRLLLQRRGDALYGGFSSSPERKKLPEQNRGPD